MCFCDSYNTIIIIVLKRKSFLLLIFFLMVEDDSRAINLNAVRSSFQRKNSETLWSDKASHLLKNATWMGLKHLCSFSSSCERYMSFREVWN